jgi:uncharacterized protein (TIGR01777 family)
MRIVIAGGTGFLGAPLAEMYAEDGHDVRVLTRSLMSGDTRHDPGTGVPGITRVGWKPDGTAGPWASVVDGADAVVNLAGKSLGEKRWNAATKAKLRESRVLATRSIGLAVESARTPPPVWINGSAVGYYGARDNDPLTEADQPGTDFLAQLCTDWEKEASKAERPGTRLVRLRSGIVLERSGGALAEMMRPFRFFVGGRFGSGRQYVSWIHRLDWIEIVRWIVQTPTVSGAVNATAPHPVTNRHLTRALGHAMRRPSFVPAPGFALKIVVGEFANSVLTGQRVIPERAQQEGYHFRYPEIEMAFRGIFGE